MSFSHIPTKTSVCLGRQSAEVCRTERRVITETRSVEWTVKSVDTQRFTSPCRNVVTTCNAGKPDRHGYRLKNFLQLERARGSVAEPLLTRPTHRDASRIFEHLHHRWHALLNEYPEPIILSLDSYSVVLCLLWPKCCTNHGKFDVLHFLCSYYMFKIWIRVCNWFSVMCSTGTASLRTTSDNRKSVSNISHNYFAFTEKQPIFKYL
jgi:hypothetical protein